MSEEDRFAVAFAQAWRQPQADRLAALLTEDVVLYQPHLPAIRGRTAARAEFERLFAWLPSLHGDVDHACGRDGLVFIEWRMHFPIGRRTVTIPAVDRFRLHGGLGAERTVFFDQTPLYLAVGSQPRAWPGFLRYRFGGRR